jgi:lipoprotein-anchoring transpeptidase ErfK/SrfK
MIAATAWFVGSTSALSPIMNSNARPAPTHAPFHGHAEIAKPAYTPTPTAIPTVIPSETPTDTAEPVIYTEVISDTPIVEYVAPALEPLDEKVHLSYPAGNKYILVDISDQYMYVYEGEQLVFNFVASTGMNNSTSVGNFSVLNKIPSAYGATWNIWMPNWLGIYWSGSLQNGIHALPILPNGAQLWAGYLGTPISYGCVVIGAYESQLLYDWADVGTPVEIQW